MEREDGRSGRQAYSLNDPWVVARDESGRVFVCHGDPVLRRTIYIRDVDDEKTAERCIEWIRSNGSHAYWTVKEYDDEVNAGRSLTNSHARGERGLIWTEVAPSVESLTTRGSWTVIGTFRICDRDVWDAQMRELIGIA